MGKLCKEVKYEMVRGVKNDMIIKENKEGKKSTKLKDYKEYL